MKSWAIMRRFVYYQKVEKRTLISVNELKKIRSGQNGKADTNDNI